LLFYGTTGKSSCNFAAGTFFCFSVNKRKYYTATPTRRGGGRALSWQCVPLSRLAWPVNREVQCIMIEITALYGITALYCTSRMTGNARRDNGTRCRDRLPPTSTSGRGHTRKQCHSHSLGRLFMTDSLVRPCGLYKLPLDPCCHWQLVQPTVVTKLSVTNKPDREWLWHCVKVQYPGRKHPQPCVILYTNTNIL